MITLFDYQEAAVRDLRAAFARGAKAPLLVLPTGGGKTVCFTYLTARAAERGKRVLLLAHRKELVSQISAALDRWDVPHGIIAPSAAPLNHPVQVAMAQTLARRVKLDQVGRYRFDLVIIDEAHHAVPDTSWGAVLEHNREALRLGVSATPCRLDGRGLGQAEGGYFDAIVVGPSVADLVERGRLARPVVYAPDRMVDLSGVKKSGGDYNRGELAAKMDHAALTGDAVEHYRRLCGGAPAIAFTVTVEHSEHVAEDFRRAGFQAAVLTGATPDRERAQMIRDLGAGALHVLASCNVISEGTDIPTVTAAILLRPTASYALAMQQMGRALRAYPGKERAILLDHAGNSLRHGTPMDPVEWSLSGAKRPAKVEGKACYVCRALVPARAEVCPGCGRVMRRPPAEQPAAPDQAELALPQVARGNLVELTPEMRAELLRWRNKAMQKAKSLQDYETIGRAMGYHRGWAWHRYQERAGGQR